MLNSNPSLKAQSHVHILDTTEDNHESLHIYTLHVEMIEYCLIFFPNWLVLEFSVEFSIKEFTMGIIQ